MQTSKAQVLLQQALQHHQAGRLAQAAAGYAQVRTLVPGGFEAHHLGGVAALQLGKLDDALRLLRRALTLNARSGPTYMCLGLAQAQLGQREEAEGNLRKATQLEPKSLEAWSNLGAGLVTAGKLEEAAEAYRTCTRLQPKAAQGWTALGSVLHLQGRFKEAAEHHSRALELDPRHPKAQASRAQSYQAMHDVARSISDFEAHLRRQPEDLAARSYRLMLLNYRADLTPAQLFEEHRAFGAVLEKSIKPAPLPLTWKPGERLRVGFISPDLRTHSVAYFLEPLLRHLDRDRFDLFLYHDHFTVDATSHRLKALAAHWRHLIGWPAERVEAQVRGDALHVLVDLAGHTGMNRLPLFARRVAPVQVTYLGYPNTTGLRTMDYRFTDAIADPPGEADALHTEKLVRFAPCAWTYAPPPDAPEVQPPPCTRGQPFTFGSFNSLSKVTDETLRLWSAVVAAVPGSRLLLKSFLADPEGLRARAAVHGIAPERLVLLGTTATTAEHLACYHQVDVALDTVPYNGTTTTCEALWMGVPVLTLRGNRHASRVGASLLHAIGRDEWVAEDHSSATRMAAILAADREVLGKIRSRQRLDLTKSLLMGHEALASQFSEKLIELHTAREVRGDRDP